MLLSFFISNFDTSSFNLAIFISVCLSFIRSEFWKKRKNSFGRKVRNFFLTIIFVIILLGVGFYFGKQYLTEKETELKNKKMSQTYQSAITE